MARTNITDKQLRAPYNKLNGTAIKAKFDDHDTALDVLIPSGTSAAGLKSRATLFSVRAVTVSNLASFAGISTTFDGLTLVEGDRILVAAQSTPAQNGIYVVGAVAGGVATWARAADFVADAVIPGECLFVVDAGTIGANRIYKTTNAGAITVATTSLAFALVSTPQSVSQAATALSGAGAVAITAPTCLFTSTGAGNALTVPDGTYIGQQVNIVHIVKGSSGTGVITQTTGAKLTAGISTITLSTVYASVTLEWSGTLWNVVTNAGCTIA
jgi:hypothetical protein